MNKGKPYNPYLAKPITIIFLILFWILGGCISVPKIIPEAKSLTISTDPAGASISVNGEYVGLSPTLYKIKNKPYSLVVRAEKQGFPVKISDVARTGGVFPQNINIALETLLPSGSTTLSPTAEPVVNNPTEIIHQAGMPFTDPGVQAADNVDGDLSTRVIVGGDTVDPYKPGIYKITYNVVDSAGNRSPQIIRTVVVQDSLKPTITLQGGASIEIEAGSAFNDPGAKASDNLDGDISSNVQAIGEPINVNKLGLYTVVYTVSDGSGNQADPVTRTVRVKDTTAPKITLIGGGGTSSTTAVLPSSAIPVAPQPITNPVTVPSPTSPSLPPPAFPTPAPVVQPQPSTVPFTTTIPKVNPPVPVTPAPTRSPAPITLPTPVSPPVSPTIVPAPAVAPTPPPPTSPFSPPATSVANPIASPFTPPVAPTASTPSPFAPATPAAPTTPAPSPFAPATPAAEPPKPAASPFAPGSNPFAPAAPKATTTSNPFAPSTPVIPKNLIQKNESTGPAIVEKTDSADSKKTAPKPSILPVIAEPEE